MARALQRTLFATSLLTLIVRPAWAQDTKPAPKQAPASAPVVDPDAPKYSTEKIYVPPGTVKSVEIGNFYLKKKKYNGALSRFKEAVAEDSGYAPAYLGLGKVYEHMGLKQKALDAYKKYLDALPSEKDALEAKNVQRAVARLEKEIKSQGPSKNGHASNAEAEPQLK